MEVRAYLITGTCAADTWGLAPWLCSPSETPSLCSVSGEGERDKDDRGDGGGLGSHFSSTF